MSPDEPGDRPVRIAHAYGNRREQIERANAADIDFMEADLWFRAGEVWVRHERRCSFIPLLYDGKSEEIEDFGPWALTVFPGYYVKLDLNPMLLSELLERTRGRSGLLLDLKGNYSDADAYAYAESLSSALADADTRRSVVVCGQTDSLDHVREVAEDLDVRYSIERVEQWEALKRRLDARPGIRGVCMHRQFFQREGVIDFLQTKGLEAFLWTVDDLSEAGKLLKMGAAGIISNRLDVLERLNGT